MKCNINVATTELSKLFLIAKNPFWRQIIIELAMAGEQSEHTVEVLVAKLSGIKDLTDELVVNEESVAINLNRLMHKGVVSRRPIPAFVRGRPKNEYYIAGGEARALWVQLIMASRQLGNLTRTVKMPKVQPAEVQA